jgi:ComF family protein
MSNATVGIFDNCLVIARWLLSPACLLCRADCGEEGLCAGCRKNLPHIPAARCPICAIANPTAQVCGRCLVERPCFDRVVAPFSYEFPATVLVQGLKYRGELACARPLAAGLVEALEREPYPDLLVPMPLAPARAAQRGFNQSMEISRLVAAEFGLEVSPDLCRRTREGAPQATLPWKQRAKNIRNAFACDADLTGRRVTIVDDVLTTGATLNELALTLKRQGAAEVSGWIVARTPAPGDA